MAYPSYHRRPLATIQRIKSFLALDFVLRTTVRLCTITAIISIIGQSQTGYSKKAAAGVVPEDCVLVGWLLTSTAVFVPGFLLADIALCCWIAYGVRFLDINKTLGWIVEDQVVMNGQVGIVALGFAFFLEFLSLLVLGFTRIIGVVIAIFEICYDEDETPITRRLLALFFTARYDWWTLKSLPREYLLKPWYKRFLRPIGSFSSPNSADDVRSLAAVWFGAHTFRSRRGERLWFATCRGIVAMFVLMFVVYYSGRAIILQPLVEHVQVPIQLQRVPSLPISTSTPTWGVVLAIDTRLVPVADQVDLTQVISVTAGISITPTAAGLPPCIVEAVKPPASIAERWGAYRFLSYDCPTGRITTRNGEGQLAISVTPQILVSVDYSLLRVTRENFIPEGSLKVWPRLTEDIHDVLISTNPTSLIIGNHVIASVHGAIWGFFNEPGRATFGFDSTQRAFITGRLTILGTDFTPDASLDRARDASSSIRIFQELQSAEWEMYTQVRNHSIIDGFSTLGGLSVFLNSLLIILFGGGLMMILFDAKPLDTFGLLHRFSSSTLERQLRNDFPLLCTEGNQPGDQNAGTVAFLREYMVNLPVTPTRIVPECERTLTGAQSGHDGDEPHSGDDDDDDKTRTDHSTTSSRVDDNTVSTKSQWNSISIHPIAIPAKARPPRNLLERFWPFAKRPKDFSRRDLEVASWSRKPDARDHGRYYSQSTAASSRGFADDDWDRRAWYSSFASGQ